MGPESLLWSLSLPTFCVICDRWILGFVSTGAGEKHLCKIWPIGARVRLGRRDTLGREDFPTEKLTCLSSIRITQVLTRICKQTHADTKHLAIHFSSARMSLQIFKTILSSLNIAAQGWVATSSGFGGVSGQDSILSACVASLDPSLGLLFLWGLLNLITDGKNPRVYTSRWGMLHSDSSCIRQRFKLSLRTSWWKLSSSTRRAEVYWCSSPDKSVY